MPFNLNSKQDLPLDFRLGLKGTEEENHGVESHKKPRW